MNPLNPANLLSQAPYTKLVKPETVLQSQFLTSEEKSKFHKGVNQLWLAITTKPIDDPNHQQALQKLKEFTTTYANRFRAQASQPNASQPNVSQSNVSQPAAPRPTSQGQPRLPQPTNNAPTTQTVPDPPAKYLQQTEQIEWTVPKNEVNNPKYLPELKKRFAMNLWTKDEMKKQLDQWNMGIQANQNQNKDVPPEWEQKRNHVQAQMRNAEGFVNGIVAQQKQLRNESANNVITNNPGLNHQNDFNATPQNANRLPPQQQAFQAGTATPRPPQQKVPASARQPPPNLPVSYAAQNTQAQISGRTPLQGTTGAFNQSPQTMAPGGTPQQPVPHTHQSAIAAAAIARSAGQGQNTPQQNSGVSQSQAMTRPDGESRASQNKWPMGGSQWVPQPHQPVNVGQGRPTLMGPNSAPTGMIGQPAIPQQPTFQLHGAGDRVLDKKKLDELVRQVTGGGDGNEGEGLQPEVEEVSLCFFQSLSLP